MAKRRRKTPIGFILLLLIVAVSYSYLKNHGYLDRLEPPSQSLPQPDDARRLDESLPPEPSRNVALGLPTFGVQFDSTSENLLIERSAYVLSYNGKLGRANWVSWHVDRADLGKTQRSQFAPDPDLPEGIYRVTPNDYRNSGFDRGHVCPSADRSADKLTNASTFYMTNIVPQSPDNNQGPWADFEEYCRKLVYDGQEVYIVAGSLGVSKRIGKGRHVSVPETLWKVVLVIDDGSDDLQRIDRRTRVIALVLPNRQGVRGNNWRDFKTNVDQIEQLTGLDLFSSVPIEIQNAIESTIDTQ